MYTNEEIKSIKAISGRRSLELLDSRISSFLDVCEHNSPDLHHIHDKESCSLCKHKSLVHDLNEPTEEMAAHQVLNLFYDLRTGSIVEKETMCSYETQLGSARQKILSALIEHRIFIPTQTLVAISGLVNTGLVSKTIQKINKIFAKNFNTDQKLIIGKIGKGYRLNPAIRFASSTNNI